MTYNASNPEHYAGWACGDIGERLTANGYQVLKYCWRLGKKDEPVVELGKAVRYSERECDLFARLQAIGITMRTAPLVLDLPDPDAFFRERIADQPEFTQTVARLLWQGYNHNEMQAILDLIATERARYASS